MHPSTRLAAVALLTLCLACTGCTTTRFLPVPSAATASNALPQPQSKVTVTLSSGEVRKFKLTGIEADALVGEDVRVPFSDIEKLQETSFSARRTLGLIGGTLVVIAGAVYLALLDYLGDEE
jgi:hypothetical protein